MMTKTATMRRSERLLLNCSLGLDSISTAVVEYNATRGVSCKNVFRHLCFIETRLYQVWPHLTLLQRESIYSLIRDFLSNIVISRKVKSVYVEYTRRLRVMLSACFRMTKRHRTVHLMEFQDKIPWFQIEFDDNTLTHDLNLTTFPNSDQVDTFFTRDPHT